MRSLILAGACTLLVVAADPAAAAGAVPHFSHATLYRTVRTKLIKLGWQPYRVPGSRGCDWENCKGFPETVECFGVGVAPCVYAWKRGDRFLKVIGEGEGDQNFGALEQCRAIYEDRFGWECRK